MLVNVHGSGVCAALRGKCGCARNGRVLITPRSAAATPTAGSGRANAVLPDVGDTKLKAKYHVAEIMFPNSSSGDKAPRPINSEIAKFLPPAEWFDVWWDAAEFSAAVDAHKQRVPVDEFMCRPQLKPLREAWAAARFAAIRSQDRLVSIRLERDQFPDFHLRVREEIQQFELREADHPGRKRGDEYRAAAVRKTAGLAAELEHFDPDEDEQAAVTAIGDAIKAKASKGYWPSPHLLVYVNFFLFRDPPITSLHASELAKKYSASFPSAWLLWGRFAVRLWPSPARIRNRTRQVA